MYAPLRRGNKLVTMPPTDGLPNALDRLFARTAHGIRPGLEIIQRLLADWGHPEQTVPVFHIAGTNGKGSVCAMLASVLQHAGYRTGCYTSPHLIQFNERFLVNGVPIPDEDLARYITEIETIADRVACEPGVRPATFFECATAIAYRYFHEQQVDWAVIETGLGGRWDATNVGNTQCAVLTQIDIDHTRYLGHTIEAIAREKAGIIKPGTPVIRGHAADAVAQILDEEARRQKALVIRADEIVRIERLGQDWNGQKIRLETDERTCRPMVLPLVGRHQLDNTALVVAALELMQAMGRVVLTNRALEKGLAECVWRGRCQVLSTQPVVLLDVAHNPSGAAALGRTISECAKKQPVAMIVGFLDDKDVAGCLRIFAHRADRFWVVPVESPRAKDPQTVQQLAEQTGVPATLALLPDALRDARAWAVAENGVVVVAGSLYLAGEVLKDWKDSQDKP